MSNPFTPVKGYRSLSDGELELINSLKELSEHVGQSIELLRQDPAHDQRWISIGVTHLQQGFMAVIRGVAKPTTF
jgi:hypothetical protein